MIRVLFTYIFYFGIILICIIFLPALFLPKKIVLFGGKLMGIWSEFCLKILLSVKLEIKGKENIIKNEKFFIACTHQSAFETYYLQVIFKNPTFILKKITFKIRKYSYTFVNHKNYNSSIVIGLKDSDCPYIHLLSSYRTV